MKLDPRAPSLPTSARANGSYNNLSSISLSTAAVLCSSSSSSGTKQGQHRKRRLSGLQWDVDESVGIVLDLYCDLVSWKVTYVHI